MQSRAAAPVVAVFLDDVHIEFNLTSRVRQMLRQVASLLFRDGDLCAAWSTGYSAIQLDVTSDLSKFSGIVNRVQGAGLTATELERGALALSDMVTARALVTSETLRGVLDQLRAVRGHSKVLLYLSSEPSLNVRTLEATSRSAGVTVYVVDPIKFVDQPAEFEKLLARINAENR